MAMKFCTRRGCGQQYSEASNTNDQACVHHPGAPQFHDSYKTWSCCGQKSSDFDQFLALRGCARSTHTDAAQSMTAAPSPNAPLGYYPPVLTPPPAISPPVYSPPVCSSAPMLPVPITCDSATRQQNEATRAVAIAAQAAAMGPVPEGAPCLNVGQCKAVYSAATGDTREDCVYHPGEPKFHEGHKSWTCCGKSTFDFTTFLNQPGCTTGKHLWTKPLQKTTTTCRRDFYQTLDSVIVTYYARAVDPVVSAVHLNPTKLNVHLSFVSGVFDEELQLAGEVDPARSSAEVTGSKLEIRLVKCTNSGTWPDLARPL